MIKPKRTAYRIALSGMAYVLFCAAAAHAEIEPNPADLQSNWLRIVPGDAGFYAEMHDLAATREIFRKLGIWDTIRELTDRNIAAAPNKPWQKTTQEDLGLEPEDAITRLLGRRAALIATAPARWQSGVVLIELSDPADLRYWLRQWQSRRLEAEGQVQRFELQGGVLLASLGRTLVLGPAEDPEGLWSRTVLLLSGRRGPMLAGRSDFAALRARLSREYDGLLYVVWPEGDPNAIEGCTRLLAGLSITKEAIECELRGQRSGSHDTPPSLRLDLLEMLPASTWAAQAGSFDLARAAKSAIDDDHPGGDAMLLLLLSAFSGSDQDSGLLRDIGPGFVFACDDNRAPGHKRLLRLPSIAVICEARNGDLHAERLETLMNLLSQALAWAIAPQSDTPSETKPVRKVELAGATVRIADIGDALANRTGLPFLSSVSLCWAHVNGRIIATTSEDHIRRVLIASETKRGRLMDNRHWPKFFPRKETDGPVAEWIFVKGGELAQVLHTWDNYIRTQQPEAMKPEFWQKWAQSRLEERGRLGIGLVDSSEKERAALVREVSIQSPAIGKLVRGDVIIEVGGRPLETDHPAREVAQRYAARGNTTSFDLRVVRRGETIDVKIPVYPAKPLDLRGFDPVRAIRQIMILTQRTQSVTAMRYATPSDRYDARIVIGWKQATPKRRR